MNLRLADVLENKLGGAADDDIEYAAAELRRLHALNAELVEALQEMLEIWEDDPAYGHEAADRARAALAKVEDSK